MPCCVRSMCQAKEKASSVGRLGAQRSAKFLCVPGRCLVEQEAHLTVFAAASLEPSPPDWLGPVLLPPARTCLAVAGRCFTVEQWFDG